MEGSATRFRLRLAGRAALNWTRGRTPGGAAMVFLTIVALGMVAAAPAGAQSQGPNNPSGVVNDPSVGTQAWVDPQNAAVSDDVYAFFNFTAHEFVVSSQYLKATGFGFAIPNGSIIEGIEMKLELKGFSCFDANVRIVKGGVIGAVN